MPVIEAQCASILVPHDHRHINHDSVFGTVIDRPTWQRCCGPLVSAEHKVDAPADVVYRYVADMREHHPHFLPPAFSDFRVDPVAWVLARSRDSR